MTDHEYQCNIKLMETLENTLSYKTFKFIKKILFLAFCIKLMGFIILPKSMLDVMVRERAMDFLRWEITEILSILYTANYIGDLRDIPEMTEKIIKALFANYKTLDAILKVIPMARSLAIFFKEFGKTKP